MNNRTLRPAITIAVYELHGAPVSDAVVTVRAACGENQTRLRRDPAHGGYATTVDAPGRYTISVSADGFETQEREAEVGATGLQEIVVLGPPNTPYLYRGAAKVPFEPPNLLAVTAPPCVDRERFSDTVRTLAAAYGLEPRELPAGLISDNAALFALRDSFGDEDHTNFRARLAEHLGAVDVGEVVRLGDDAMIFASSEIVAKFNPGVAREDVAALARAHGLEILRWIPNIGNAVLLRTAEPATTRVFRHTDALVATGMLEYAEPNLVSTVVYDGITPKDWLYPLQWNLHTAKLSDAWQALHDALGPGRQYGDGQIVIAICDDGVDPAHPEFSGTVTGGNDKYFTAYDFQMMVPNNDMIVSPHGTRMAGIAAANADNPSSVSGGFYGIAGAAGNCRIMGVRFPYSGTELDYSDIYIWSAGFDPHSMKPGFPAPPARGADVLTSSLAVFADMPISGLMKDTFDFCAGYGRGGRGCISFFSIGNDVPPRDFTLHRPWASYVKNFAVGVSSLANDGTENHAPYGNYSGPMSSFPCCSPSNSVYNSVVLDPPASYAVVTTDLPAMNGNVPSAPLTTTTLTAAASAGDTTLAVASTTGLIDGSWILVGQPALIGSESVRIGGVSDGTHFTISPVSTLKHAYPAGTAIIGGPNDITSNEGNSSSATSLAAGIAALILSAKPSMTWLDVRAAIRATATKIDTANTDAIGRWRDGMGRISSDPGYAGPQYSPWYGYGRIDAGAAVSYALAFTAQTVLVRDELGDSGAVPSTGTFWESPDIWVRNADPAGDPAAFPAAYGDPGPHQAPSQVGNNHVCVRLKNVGTGPSEQGTVRIYLAHFAGAEFLYPGNFVPTNNPGVPVSTPMQTGTYLLGEVAYPSIAAGSDITVHTPWPSALIPPQTVTVSGNPVLWHPCILAEVSPHDGVIAGSHVWDSPSLAQKNVTIAYVTTGPQPKPLAAAMVLGNGANPAEYVVATIDTTNLPDGMRAFVHVADERANANLHRFVHEKSFTVVPSQAERRDERGNVIQEIVDEVVEEVEEFVGALLRRRKGSTAVAGETLKYDPATWKFTLGDHDGLPVAWLGVRAVARVPILAGRGGLVPLVVGGVVAGGSAPGTYDIVVLQEQPDGARSGAASIKLIVA